MTVFELCDIINGISPFEHACKWDNCGLLVGSGSDIVTSVYVTLDADLYALERAAAIGCNTVVSHHPVIFDPLKSITGKDIVYKYIENGISVISAHTCLDAAEGGVNDLFAKCCGLLQSEPFLIDGLPLGRVGCVNCGGAEEYIDSVKRALCSARADYVVNRSVSRVLTVCGSGGSAVSDAAAAGCDTLITGEAKHEHFVNACNFGINLFAFGHFESENIIVSSLCDRLCGYVSVYPSDRTEFIKRR